MILTDYQRRNQNLICDGSVGSGVKFRVAVMRRTIGAIGTFLILAFAVGCHTSKDFSRSKAKNLIDDYFKAGPGPAVFKPTDDEVKQLVNLGAISVVHNIFL